MQPFNYARPGLTSPLARADTITPGNTAPAGVHALLQLPSPLVSTLLSTGFNLPARKSSSPFCTSS